MSLEQVAYSFGFLQQKLRPARCGHGFDTGWDQPLIAGYRNAGAEAGPNADVILHLFRL